VSRGVDRQRRKGLGEAETTMNRYKKWSERGYSNAQRMMAVIFGGIVFWILIPFFIVVGSSLIDPRLHLPRFFYGWSNIILTWVLMITGWFFAIWTVKVQVSSGREIPIPLMATQKLVVRRLYTKNS
jgi:hypothetical protein